MKQAKQLFKSLNLIGIVALCFLFLAPGEIIAQLQWQDYKGSIPANAVVGGKESGRNLIVCRAMYKGSYHPGKLVAGACNIGWGGKEVVLRSFQVLVNPGNVKEDWVRVLNNQIPRNAVTAGTENGQQLYVGRAKRSVDNSTHPGKVFKVGRTAICNFGWGGKEITEAKNFEVLVTLAKPAPPTSASSFRHTTSASNIAGHITTLDHPSLNGKGDLLLIVSQEYGKYNDHQIGVWYNNGKWKIYNEDRAKMPVGTQFNVISFPAGKNVFNHKAAPGNISNNWTVIDHPLCNNNPDAVILVTQNYKSTYNARPIGVYYTNGKWAIFNQDKATMPNGTTFNVLVLNRRNISSIPGGDFSVLTANASTKNSTVGKHIAKTNQPSTGLLFATQNWKSRGVYNNNIIGVYNDQGKWSVYNQNKKELPNNTMFNLLYVR